MVVILTPIVWMVVGIPGYTFVYRSPIVVIWDSPDQHPLKPEVARQKHARTEPTLATRTVRSKDIWQPFHFWWGGGDSKTDSGSEFRKKNNALKNWLLQRCCIFTRTFWRNDHNLTSCFSFNGCQAAQLEDNSNKMLVNNNYRYIFY